MPCTPHDILRRVFGYDSFRGRQEEVINHLLAGKDGLLLMPTGSGKSLCYQIPAMLRPGLGIVISPLIALMQDQVARLRQRSVRAAYLNSTLTIPEAWEVKRQMMSGTLDLLYVSPERAMMSGFLRVLGQIPLALFAIDEAHCVSQWGHDFRPEYRELYQLRQRFPGVPRLALTATADLHTRRDILEGLQLPPDCVFTTSFDRPNLDYQVVPKENWRQQVIAFLRSREPGSAGIIYRLTRNSVEETAQWLKQQGFKALPYHAGLEDEVRRRHQERFLREQGLIIVATIAFGMGIDKTDVRFVAHLDMPKSLEDYHQQTGRAGRDGKPAVAWMTYGASDATLLGKLIERDETDQDFKRIEKRRLQGMIRFCQTSTCRRRLLLDHFGEKLGKDCGHCDNCRAGRGDWDATVQVEQVLLCMLETRERFGASYLADILTGSRNKRVRTNGHTRLQTFGAGQELTATEWRVVISQMVGLGLVSQDTSGYAVLKLNQASEELLSHQRRVLLRRSEVTPQRRGSKAVRTARSSAGQSTVAQSGAGALAGGDGVLFEQLRRLRTKLAKEAGAPAFTVFSDRTLREFAIQRPAATAEMLQVIGVGETKLARYGKAFLKVIRDHEREEGPA